jgi:plasmid stabilization system protein ParE
MKRVRLSPEAAEELTHVEEWYYERAGLGAEFVLAVRAAAARIAQMPRSFPLASTVAPEIEVRRCVLKRFPYSIFFIDLESEIRILAIAHGRRRPGYWRSRI